ncbi:putative tetratricopeptide repeat protein [Lyophyllum shimeji]|uniref:Tetratricopeptide repeat protein n=1 Tax=Lyophyllum shimeji TaxID=47721 RepID=A0A9P3UKF5_LYOSH|nr:putative tetratricopeptide repeat protein [Lyophyllum shimeji]
MTDLLTTSTPESTSPIPDAENVVLDITASLRAAEELKAEGNDYFRARQWDQALVAYRSGLGHLPKRSKGADVPHADGDDSSEEAVIEPETKEHPPSKEGVAGIDGNRPSQEEQAECAKLRAVLNANIGACYVKLGDHKQAITACTQALIDDPQYVKALQRRASSNEAINSWTSLSAAQEDYNALLKLLPQTDSQWGETERSLTLLKPRLEAAQKQETAEMLDKLKGLGNSILGNFGLSTDNFKFEPNGQGGYSINFSG